MFLANFLDLEEILLQLLAPVVTWIHYERQRSNQPKLSLDDISVVFIAHYFTNPSYCSINQSEFCGPQRTQKWTNWGLYSRRSFFPSLHPPPSFFSPTSLSPPPPPPFYTPATQAKAEKVFYFRNRLIEFHYRSYCSALLITIHTRSLVNTNLKITSLLSLN